MTALDAEGFQVHFHALGDRAVRNALDAIEAARTASGAPRRSGITWPTSRSIHPDDVPRFARAVGHREHPGRCGPPTSRRWTT